MSSISKRTGVSTVYGHQGISEGKLNGFFWFLQPRWRKLLQVTAFVILPISLIVLLEIHRSFKGHNLTELHIPFKQWANFLSKHTCDTKMIIFTTKYLVYTGCTLFLEDHLINIWYLTATEQVPSSCVFSSLKFDLLYMLWKLFIVFLNPLGQHWHLRG